MCENLVITYNPGQGKIKVKLKICLANIEKIMYSLTCDCIKFDARQKPKKSLLTFVS